VIRCEVCLTFVFANRLHKCYGIRKFRPPSPKQMFCAVVKFSVMAIQGEGVASNGNGLARTPLSDLFKGKLSGFRAFVFVGVI